MRRVGNTGSIQPRFVHVLILPLCFATGILLGNINFESILRITAESYTNRYLAMSGSERRHITYYAYAKKPQAIRQSIEAVPGVLSVTQSGPTRLYDVVIDYPQRREVVKALRELPELMTLFTVPLLCH